MDNIHDVHERIIRIEDKLDKLLYLVEKNHANTENMSQHIDFVDSVYESVKAPLNTICNKISYFSSKKNNDKEMLELPYKKE